MFPWPNGGGRRSVRSRNARRTGQVVSPVAIEGRKIVVTFWGKSWCENLERYSDYANRLPRGRTYVRNGSVVDLQIGPGVIKALVCGSEMYEVELKIKPVDEARWQAICHDCAGAVDSLVELLQGRLSKGVMERICQRETGLFPAPSEIKLDCSCPDWAGMCKHVAAVLYGVGARLDKQPELLFRLREVDEQQLIAQAATALPLTNAAPASARLLDSGDLSEIFGLDMALDSGPSFPPQEQSQPKPKRATTKSAAKKNGPAAARKSPKKASARKAATKRPKKRPASKPKRAGK